MKAVIILFCFLIWNSCKTFKTVEKTIGKADCRVVNSCPITTCANATLLTKFIPITYEANLVVECATECSYQCETACPMIPGMEAVSFKETDSGWLCSYISIPERLISGCGESGFTGFIYTATEGSTFLKLECNRSVRDDDSFQYETPTNKPDGKDIHEAEDALNTSVEVLTNEISEKFEGHNLYDIFEEIESSFEFQSPVSCGNGICEGPIEHCDTCPEDCSCKAKEVCIDGNCMNCNDYCQDKGLECGLDGGCFCGSCPKGAKCLKGNCISSNYCGDGICSYTEGCSTCLLDCKCNLGNVCFEDQCINCKEYCAAKGMECGDLAGCNCGSCQDGSNKCIGGKCVATSFCGDAKCDANEFCDTCQDCSCSEAHICLNKKCLACTDACEETGKQCGTLLNCNCGACEPDEVCDEGKCQKKYKNECGGTVPLENPPGKPCGLAIPTVWQRGCYDCSGENSTICVGENCSICQIACYWTKIVGCGLGAQAVCITAGLNNGFLLSLLCEAVVAEICQFIASDNIKTCDEICYMISWCPKEPCKE